MEFGIEYNTAVEENNTATGNRSLLDVGLDNTTIEDRLLSGLDLAYNKILITLFLNLFCSITYCIIYALLYES